MAKKQRVVFTTAPVRVEIGVTPAALCSNLRVLDKASGTALDAVLMADAEAGRVRRYEVKDGDLVREGNSFKLVEEDRAVTIEWIDPPAAEAPGADEEPAADPAVAPGGDA